MVWLLPGAESVKVSIIIIVTHLVGTAGFDHIVADSTTALFVVVTKSVSGTTYPARAVRMASECSRGVKQLYSAGLTRLSVCRQLVASTKAKSGPSARVVLSPIVRIYSWNPARCIPLNEAATKSVQASEDEQLAQAAPEAQNPPRFTPRGGNLFPAPSLNPLESIPIQRSFTAATRSAVQTRLSVPRGRVDFAAHSAKGDCAG